MAERRIVTWTAFESPLPHSGNVATTRSPPIACSATDMVQIQDGGAGKEKTPSTGKRRIVHRIEESMANEQIQKVSEFMRSETVKARFAEVVGSSNAGAYISSVLLAVANSDNLKECTVESVYISALRAATLRLSCDPSTGQAYLVPFGKKATLIVGYKGLQDMAVRTGRYRFINTSPIYEGEEIKEDRFTGELTLTGNKQSDILVGWLAAFELMSGYSKALYMSIDEIHDHAKKYSKSYAFKESGWQTNVKEMERKTVLRRLLRRWGYLDPADVSALETLESDQPGEVIDIPAADVTETEPEPAKSEEQLMNELGY